MKKIVFSGEHFKIAVPVNDFVEAFMDSTDKNIPEVWGIYVLSVENVDTWSETDYNLHIQCHVCPSGRAIYFPPEDVKMVSIEPRIIFTLESDLE